MRLDAVVTHAQKAAEVRQLVGDLFVAEPCSSLVLSPGILISLRVLFSALGVQRLVMTDEEYYDPEHFVGLETEVAPASKAGMQAVKREADAVLVSLVTWRGNVLDLARIRKDLADAGRSAPLMVVDYSHAGAVGFPAIARLGADIVAGDPCKWVMPTDEELPLAFLWSTEVLTSDMRRAFRRFFLATDESDTDWLSGRWLDPRLLEDFTAWASSARPTRSSLRARSERDRNVAEQLRKELHLPQGESSIVWSPDDIRDDASVRRADKAGLVWTPPGGGTRILGRSDLI